MNFISPEFLVFFAIVFAVYWILSHRAQNVFLLCASYFFYGWWDYRFLSLLLLSTCVDFFCARAVDRELRPELSDSVRRCVLATSLAVNLGVLSVFKYYNFFADSLQAGLETFGIAVSLFELELVLPVGISFYTFQTISYTVDVYRGELKSCPRFIDCALYVSFFPQLVAGPIERGTHFIPQVMRERSLSWGQISLGFQLALWGYFKKVVIADNLALIVSTVYSSPAPNGLDVLIATYAFALQIYCDFSGYTDIARGLARAMGFDICENFRLPYFATNPSDFWNRWHVSLSTWLRDYLYIPLGGNRHGTLFTYRNLLITMLLGGLWHGASWNFVLWGLYHGLILCVFRFWQRSRTVPTTPKVSSPVYWLKVVLYFQVTCFGWLLFRASDLSEIQILLTALFDPTTPSPYSYYFAWHLLAGFLLLLPIELIQLTKGDMEPWSQWSLISRSVFYTILICGCLWFSTPYEEPFIYFQF